VSLAGDAVIGTPSSMAAIRCLSGLGHSSCFVTPALSSISCAVAVVAGLTSDLLMQLLANASGRVVVNHPGLAGPFAVDLEWSQDQSVSDKPSLFTAVQEQLGLKLESTRGPVDVLVIDKVERPTPD
jgi:uncharacterized protein (TIGR03435 family)